MKKTLIILTAIFCLTVLGVMQLSSSITQAAYAPVEGDLIKLANDSAIYYVNRFGERSLFVNAPTFWSWYSGTWGDQIIKIINQSDFDNLVVGENKRVRPGTNLIKFQNSNNTFAVTPGNKLCKATDGYGDNWRDRLVTIQNSFESNYIMDANCQVNSSAKLPDGTIFKWENGSQYFYIEKGIGRIFANDGFKTNKFQDKFVVTVPGGSYGVDVYNAVDSQEFWVDDLEVDISLFSFIYDVANSSASKASFVFVPRYRREHASDSTMMVDLYIDGVVVKSSEYTIGGADKSSITWDNPTAGNHTAKIFIDSKNNIVESSEANNNSNTINFSVNYTEDKANTALTDFYTYVDCLRDYDKDCVRDFIIKSELADFDYFLKLQSINALFDEIRGSLYYYSTISYDDNWIGDNQLILNKNTKKDNSDGFIGYIWDSLKFIKEDNKWKVIGEKSRNIGDGLDNFSDTDKDGLIELEEKQIGTDPNKFDTDGDGWWDGIESQLGINPNDSSSKP